MKTVCPESELLPEYLTERLEHTDAVRMEDHLAGCDICKRLADELEIGLAAMAIARDEIDREQTAALIRPSSGGTSPVAARRRRARWIPNVAAACAALVIGTGLGVAIERLTAGPETIAEFTLASASDSDSAAGTATLAVVAGGLQVGLELAGLPGDADFFECLWHTDGGTRSAGTFAAAGGVANVDLVVAPFAGPPKWTLDIVAHIPGEEPRVVLTAST